MTIASFLSSRRRVLAICVGSVLLHFVAIDWAGEHIGRQGGAGVTPQPALIVAQLRAPPPPPPPPAPLASAPPAPVPVPAAAPAKAPVPKAAKPAAPAPAPVPVPAEPAPGPALEAVAAGDMGGEPEGEMDGRGMGSQSLASDSDMSAPPVDAAVQSVAPAPAPPAAAEPSQAQALAKPARYKVSLPPSADLTLDVARTDAAGANWSGLMTLAWKQGAGAYSVKMEASISMLVTRVTLATLSSEGAIDDLGGIAPRLSTEKRRGRSQTATHFDAQEQRITFSASERSYPLFPGAQDKATVPLQLAGIARADSGQMAAGVDMLVGEDKDAAIFSFIVVGQEQIDTGMGRMATWHLSRPPRAGAYNSRLDIWLAPAHNWYPVRIRNTEANGAVTTQTIRKIVITDGGH